MNRLRPPVVAIALLLAGTASATDGFEPLSLWSVRIDRIENPRDDKLVHVYLTLRNDSAMPLTQTELISVLHENSLGFTAESGQSLKPQPGYPARFDPPPVTEPGGQVQAKFVFDRQPGSRTAGITVEEGRDRSATFEF